MTDDAFSPPAELDRTSWPDLRDQILGFRGEPAPPRSYPGYPRWALSRCRSRPWPALERALWFRRSALSLSDDLPPPAALGRLLRFSHGVSGGEGRGPTPSAGGLQALELYLVALTPGWLPSGLYHYDRAGHALAQLAAGAGREDWRRRVPSLGQVEGGALLWVLVGDGGRIGGKYGARGGRFLLLEAGHLMQNLCLMSWRLGLVTVPLGGFFEREVARAFALPAGDVVLYLGLCGGPVGAARS